MRAACLILSVAIAFLSTAFGGDTKVCAQCHAAIWRQYQSTPMARTSGMVDIASAPLSSRTEFTDAPTSTHFRMTRQGERTRVHFSQGEAEGERELNYFIGAGVVGRSYASTIEGYLFQAPVSYYASTGQWDLSPGFEGSAQLNLTRPVEPACLNCHATDLRPVAGTVNGYAQPAFGQVGVTCERCHGPGEAHVARMKSGAVRQSASIVNPARLPSGERDSVCAQCHLVSVIRVAKVGQGARYEPGKLLFDSTSAFQWSNGAERSGANSHYEQLVRSACWRRSEGKLWCGTCHSIHAAAQSATAVADRQSYRQRCLACHTVTAPDCSAPGPKRQAAKDDCVACHMPSKSIGTVPHASQVDHTISRIPGSGASPGAAALDEAKLVPFPGSTAGDRELGMAYADQALSQNNRAWGMRAFELLKKASAILPNDVPVLVQLAQLYDRMGQEQQACDLFTQVANHAVSATFPGAFVNLGTCQAKRGDLEGAMSSWARALRQNPALEAARLNLAVAEFQSGKKESAVAELRKALQYDPFSQRASELLRSMQ